MNTFLGSPLVMMVILMLIFLYPVARILKRTGHSGWWALLMFVPLVNFIALWVFAFTRWPALGNATRPSELNHNLTHGALAQSADVRDCAGLQFSGLVPTITRMSPQGCV